MIKKKKKDYTNLCYVALVFLIILLILPKALRIFVKDSSEKDEVKKNVVEILQCLKDKDSVNSTFLNNIPQYLDYKVYGNYTLNDDTNDSSDNNDLVDSSSGSTNTVINIIRNYAEVMYSDDDNMTTFKVNMSLMQEDKKYVGIFNNLKNQQEYFGSLAFTCSTVKY